MLKRLLLGAAAGAAGTTALNAVTYLDMVLRARPSSDTPERVVQELAERSGQPIPGTDDEVRSRLQGLGGSAMAATDLTMARLGVTDPGSWDAAAWASDAIPHLAYGAVTYGALAAWA